MSSSDESLSASFLGETIHLAGSSRSQKIIRVTMPIVGVVGVICVLCAVVRQGHDESCPEPSVGHRPQGENSQQSRKPRVVCRLAG